MAGVMINVMIYVDNSTAEVKSMNTATQNKVSHLGDI